MGFELPNQRGHKCATKINITIYIFTGLQCSFLSNRLWGDIIFLFYKE